jgi:predicted anti-sigma-YlaC factor YlaD
MNICGTDCARARESVSADLDGELCELDQRRLRSHLRACADCTAWRDLVASTTTRLREARPEAPPAFELPRRGRTERVRSARAFVSAAAVAVVASVAFLGAQHSLLVSRLSPGAAGGTPRPVDARLLGRDRLVAGGMTGVEQHQTFRAI